MYAYKSIFKSLYDYHSVRSCHCISIISPPRQQIYSGSKLASTIETKKTQTSSQTDTLKHKLYMNTLTHTYQRGGRCWSYLSVHFSLCLDPSNLRLQEQIREKTVIKVTVGSTGRHTRKRTASLYRRFTKHTKDPNYLFSCLREETSSSQISN